MNAIPSARSRLTASLNPAQRKRLLIDYSAWFLLLVLSLVAALSHPLFFTPSNLGNVLQQAVILGVLAIGQFVVILTGGIDLSVGSVMALMAMTAALLMPAGAPVSVAAALGIGGAIGALSGLITVAGGLPPFIVTFAMMAIARGIALTITAGDSVAVHDSPLSVFGFGWQPVAVWAVALVVMGIVLNRTRTGRYLYAVGGSLEAARVAGIRVKGVLVVAYAISGVCCGLAGLLTLARTGVALPTSGNAYEMQTIAAVVVGGASLMGGEGRFSGAAVGVIFMTVLSNILQLHNADPFWTFVVVGVVLWLAIALRNALERIR